VGEKESRGARGLYLRGPAFRGLQRCPPCLGPRWCLRWPRHGSQPRRGDEAVELRTVVGGSSRRCCAFFRSARVCSVGGAAAAAILVSCAAGPHLLL
jgi:hypothetical protein